MVLNNTFYPDLIIMQLVTLFSLFMLSLSLSFLGKPLFSLPGFHCLTVLFNDWHNSLLEVGKKASLLQY